MIVVINPFFEEHVDYDEDIARKLRVDHAT